MVVVLELLELTGSSSNGNFGGQLKSTIGGKTQFFHFDPFLRFVMASTIQSDMVPLQANEGPPDNVE